MKIHRKVVDESDSSARGIINKNKGGNKYE